jgi:integrase/recombinase XerD
MALWTERFFTHLRVERGLTEHTLSQYAELLERFRVWLAKPLPEATGRDIRKYLARDVKAQKKPNTTARKLSCLRMFYGFLVAEGGIRVDPSRHIRRPRVSRRVPEVLSPQDIRKLVSALEGSDRYTMRDRALVLTLYSSGLRNSEVRSLKIPDVDLAGGLIKVWRGKGGKDRVAPLSKDAARAIREYLRDGRPQFNPEPDCNTLFIGRLGRGVTRQELFYRIRDLGRDVLNRQVWPHMLRHSFATNLVRSGMDIRDIQHLGGWAEPDTARIYIHNDLRHLTEVMRDAHPRSTRRAG